MRRKWTGRGAVLTATVLTVVLSGCSGGAGSAAGSGRADDGTLSVVASTNVWAAVAKAVGGDTVTVTSVLDDPSADPHSYEASPRTKLAMSRAALILVNGGGYDDWALDTVASLDAPPPVVNAVELSGDSDGRPGADNPTTGSATTSAAGSGSDGHDGHDHGTFNEHVFYDLHAVDAVAAAVATELAGLDPANADTYRANAMTFGSGIEQLEEAAAELAAAYPGTRVVSTEPVAGYLIDELGFTDVTPTGFSAAIEADSEVSVKDLNAAETLFTDGTAGVLFHNLQTAGPVTDRLVATAEAAGAAVVGVTETLPEGTTDYLVWVRATLDAVRTALA